MLHQPTVRGAIPRQEGLSCIRKVPEQALGTEPVSYTSTVSASVPASGFLPLLPSIVACDL